NANEPRALFWHYPHYHGSTWTPGAAIRHGDWKLIEFYHEGKVELYNLPQDPGELAEVGEQFPKKRAELRQKLHDWQGRLGARMPVPFEGSSTSQN
ncbi:MAG: sulfatase/phosphatase domain-containing protein, partial [Planctomycetota bacterium]|nr:sulfatase/phosphatase domain-containing protein [Planctomycetota bacterium]